jgi:hypothetical protein
VHDVTRVPHARGFEDQRGRLVVGDGPVLRAPRDDEDLSGPDLDDAVPELDAERAP